MSRVTIVCGFAAAGSARLQGNNVEPWQLYEQVIASIDRPPAASRLIHLSSSSGRVWNDKETPSCDLFERGVMIPRFALCPLWPPWGRSLSSRGAIRGRRRRPRAPARQERRARPVARPWMRQPRAARAPAANPFDQKKIRSTIEGDRLQTIPTAIVLTEQTESSPFRFAEIAKEAGIDFVHFSGMTEEKHFPTANGSGVAVFDYDNDGLLDIYFATARSLPLGTAVKGPNRLYKNLGGNHFEDVTEASGLGFRGFCHGIIAGDIDNDGDPGRVPVQLRAERALPQQRRRNLQGHQQTGRRRRPQLVVRRRHARLRQ